MDYYNFHTNTEPKIFWVPGIWVPGDQGSILSVENNDIAQRFATLGSFDRAVDVVKRVGIANEFVQLEFAILIQADQLGNVVFYTGISEFAAQHFSTRREQVRIDREHPIVIRRHTENHGSAVLVEHVN